MIKIRYIYSNKSTYSKDVLRDFQLPLIKDKPCANLCSMYIFEKANTVDTM